MAQLRWATGTHEGQVRTINEDAAFASPQLFVVADGMGGHLAGEVASALAISTLEGDLTGREQISLDDLVGSIATANRAIFDDANNNIDHNGMGTTVTAIAVVSDRYDGEALGVANVGDSRIYLFRHGRLRQVTVDHSFVQELISEGAITREEARHHPRRNIVTRGLGIESSVRVDSWTMPLIRGDRFVLCSDGLSDYVTDEDVAAVLAKHPEDPEAAIIELINAANDAGGADNITVVIVDVLDGDDPPEPTEEIDVVPAWFDDADDTVEAFIVADPLPEDLDDASNPDPGAETDADESDDSESDDEAIPAVPAKAEGRRGRAAKFALAIGVAAVLIGSASVFAAWARSGYFVAFNTQDQVVVYRGRKGGVLWFNPTEEGTGPLDRSELDAESIALVESEPTFADRENAFEYVLTRLHAKETSSSNESTTPVTEPATTEPATTDPATTEPATSVPDKSQASAARAESVAVSTLSNFANQLTRT